MNRSTYANPYVVGDWYYLAATMSYDSGQTTIDTYAANLSQNETTLTHNAYVASGDFHTGLAYGIGVMNYSGNTNEPFTSIIDEITFYSDLKDGNFFQGNLDLILRVPEPSSVLLLLSGAGIAMLGVAMRRRRRVNSQ